MTTIVKRYGARKRYKTEIVGDTKTQKHFRDEVNINTIMEKARRTGMIPVSMSSPLYGDFTSAADFMSAQCKIAEAKEAFDALPSNIRNRFDNDPAKLIDFMSDAENKDEAIRLGLLEAPATAPESPQAPEESVSDTSPIESPDTPREGV